MLFPLCILSCSLLFFLDIDLNNLSLQRFFRLSQYLGVVITQEDLNSKFLRSLPPECNTHVVVWMNKADIKTMSIDDFNTSTNDVNTANPAYEVSTVSPDINIVCPQVGTANFSDNTVYAFMVENPNGSNLQQQDLEKIHEDDLEVMDLKECRAARNKEGQFKYQDNTRKQGNNEDTSSRQCCFRGVGFDYNYMAEEQVQTNTTLMAFSDSEITDKSKKGLGYNVVPPSHPLIYNQPKNLDLSYSGLNEFKDPEFKSYGFEDSKQESNIVCDKKSDASKENSDDSLVKEQVLEDTSSFVESSLNVDKEIVFLDKKIEFVKPKNHENPVKKSVRYAEMYRSQSPRGNQRNWNGQKSNQLGSDFVMHNKACFICGSFDHVHAHCKYHQRERMVYGNNYNKVNYKYTTNMTHPNAQRNMVPRAVLMKTGLKPFNTARIVNTAQKITTARQNGPPEKVGDEAVYKELGGRMERAATTASSLEAE
ncbi:hypothetical protein Tco_0964057 [Tanacetum coccineum]